MALDISNFATALKKFGLGSGKQSKGLSDEQLKKAFGKKKSTIAEDAGATDAALPPQPSDMPAPGSLVSPMQMEKTLQQRIDEEENKRKFFAV